MRHPLVQRIVNAYEAYEARKATARADEAWRMTPRRAHSARGSLLTVQYAAPRAGCRRARASQRWARAGAPSPPRGSRCASSARAKARALNRDYRGRDYATNVLTFAYGAARPRGRHRAVRAGHRARGARAGQRCRRALTRTSSCTACCTCRATTTRASAMRATMERRGSRILAAARLRRPLPEPIEPAPTAPMDRQPQSQAVPARAPRRAASCASPRTARSWSSCCARPTSAICSTPTRSSMIEGVLQVSEMQARDIMMPRAQMDVIDINESPDKFIPHGDRRPAHSRFPVIEREQGRRDRHPARQGPAALLRRRGGVQRARDAAPGGVHPRVEAAQRAAARSSARTATTWRSWSTSTAASPAWSRSRTCSSRSSATSRTSTTSTRSRTTSSPRRAGRFRVKALTEIADFNAGVRHPLHRRGARHDRRPRHRHFGRLPKRGEPISFDNLSFQVLRADSRRRLHAAGRADKAPAQT